MKKVFCIGELLIDFVAENQGKDLSKAKEFSKKAGGAPANVACAISKILCLAVVQIKSLPMILH